MHFRVLNLMRITAVIFLTLSYQAASADEIEIAALSFKAGNTQQFIRFTSDGIAHVYQSVGSVMKYGIPVGEPGTWHLLYKGKINKIYVPGGMKVSGMAPAGVVVKRPNIGGIDFSAGPDGKHWYRMIGGNGINPAPENVKLGADPGVKDASELNSSKHIDSPSFGTVTVKAGNSTQFIRFFADGNAEVYESVGSIMRGGIQAGEPGMAKLLYYGPIGKIFVPDRAKISGPFVGQLALRYALVVKRPHIEGIDFSSDREGTRWYRMIGGNGLQPSPQNPHEVDTSLVYQRGHENAISCEMLFAQ